MAPDPKDVLAVFAGLSAIAILAGGMLLLVVGMSAAGCEDDSIGCALMANAAPLLLLAAVALLVLGCCAFYGLRRWAEGQRTAAFLVSAACAAVVILVFVVVATPASIGLALGVGAALLPLVLLPLVRSPASRDGPIGI